MLKKRGIGDVPPADGQFPFLLHVRLAIGLDADAVLGSTLDQFVSARRLVSVSTARQGLSINATYKTALRADDGASALVNALNRLEGVQNVELQRVERTAE